MDRIETEILIIGGGAAGMSAAISAAGDGGKITIVDDNPHLGGQIWRAELGRTRSPDAIKLISEIESGQIRILNNSQVFAAAGENCLAVETSQGRPDIAYRKLIIATGARERFLPFPGWTLPNVFGAGGLQALVKGGLNIENKRIIVAGTGPLLLAVAEYLGSKRAKVLAIVEQTSAANLRRFAFGLWRSPRKVAQAISLRRKLVGIPYFTDCWVTAANGSDKIESVTLTRKGKNWPVDCDMLASGFHLVPNIELASLLGCHIENGFVAVDAFQRTSCENILCAGEPTGIGGVDSALVEGTIAGHAAAGNAAKAHEFFTERDNARKFAASLNDAFALRRELRNLADEDTIVCRCEDVRYGRLREFGSWRQAKLQTRCGMGACQGRICGSATEVLFDWKDDSLRPPIFPVRMENL